MKKIILTLVALFTHAAFAATPITCTALRALGYNYLYFGFTTSGSTDTFTIAHSPDAVNWTNLGGTWPTCGNGSPCAVNSPSAVCYNDNLYLLIAEANDANLNSTKQDIGVLNTDYSVTTLLTFDWASLGSVSTVFAGRWAHVAGSENCFTTPVTFTGGYFTWSNYQACATLTPTSASIASGPNLLTNTGSPNGMYDTAIIKAGSTCYLVGTEAVSGGNPAVSAISSGSCPSGPFTWQGNAFSPGSPLAAQTTVSTRAEGPNYIQTTVAGGWYFWFEAVNSVTPGNGQMYYANCTPIAPTSCVIATPQPWIEDQHYRAGTILRMTSTPLPATTLTGATLTGGTLQ